MEGIPATYLGKIVSKIGFRVFIYGANGAKKLVESWDDFESHMQTGIWFARIEDSKVAPQDVVAPKSKKTGKA